MSDTRQHIHELIDRLPDTQLTTVAGLLESMVDPVETTLRNAPFDDEPETEAERLAVAQARASIERSGGKAVPHHEAMRRLGLE
jgi:hypothetical protein